MEILVLGPGGIKGYQELGALYYLEETGKLSSVHTLIGVSVGAIISLLYNIGLSIKEILYLSIKEPNFVDADNLDIFSIFSNFNKYYGVFSNSKIKNTLTEAIVGKLGYIPTLNELHKLTSRNLTVVTYNLTQESTIYISHETHPDISCVDAVLLSINIPVLFHMINISGEIFIDGAFGDPYPVLLKDDGRNRILGIYIETKCNSKENIILYIHNIIHCLFTNLTKRNIREASNNCKHMGLKCEIIDTIGMNVTLADKVKMFLYGYSVAKSFNYDY